MFDDAFDLICRLTGGDSIQTTSLLSKVCGNESGLFCDSEISVRILLNSIKMVQQIYTKQSFVNTRDEIYSLLPRLGKTKSTQEPVQNSVHGLEAPSQLVDKQLAKREPAQSSVCVFDKPVVTQLVGRAPVQSHNLLALPNEESRKEQSNNDTQLVKHETNMNSNVENQESDEMVTNDFEEAQPNRQFINESRHEDTQFGAQESFPSAWNSRSHLPNVQANADKIKVVFITKDITLPRNLICFMESTGCKQISRTFKNSSKVMHYVFDMTYDAIERIDPLIEGYKMMVIPIGWYRAEIIVRNSSIHEVKQALEFNVLISDSYKDDVYNITTDSLCEYEELKRSKFTVSRTCVQPIPRAKYKYCDKCFTAFDCYHICNHAVNDCVFATN